MCRKQKRLEDRLKIEHCFVTLWTFTPSWPLTSIKTENGSQERHKHWDEWTNQDWLYIQVKTYIWLKSHCSTPSHVKSSRITHTPRLQAKNKQETSQSEEMDFLCRTFRQITSFVQQPVLTEKESHTHTHTHTINTQTHNSPVQVERKRLVKRTDR